MAEAAEGPELRRQTSFRQDDRADAPPPLLPADRGANPSCNPVSIKLASSTVNDPSSAASPLEGCGQPFMCPLSKLNVGAACRIKQLFAAPEIAHRLRELGFCEEQRIQPLSQQANFISQVCNVRYGISAELAEAIWVEPLSANDLAA